MFARACLGSRLEAVARELISSGSVDKEGRVSIDSDAEKRSPSSGDSRSGASQSSAACMGHAASLTECQFQHLGTMTKVH